MDVQYVEVQLYLIQGRIFCRCSGRNCDGMRDEVGCHRFVDGGDEATVRITMITPAHVVRIDGQAIGINRREVSERSVGEFRRDAHAAVEFVEVEISADCFSQVTEISVVLDVMADGTKLVHILASLGTLQHGRTVLLARFPRRQCFAASLREVVGSVLAIARDKAGNHPAHGAGWIGRIGKPVRPVERIAVRRHDLAVLVLGK